MEKKFLGMIFWTGIRRIEQRKENRKEDISSKNSVLHLSFKKNDNLLLDYLIIF